MIKWTVAGKPRMALFAGDNVIMTGEELTYDYNFEYGEIFARSVPCKTLTLAKSFLLEEHPRMPLWRSVLPWGPGS